ncbi:hypothetical protein I317_00342 [Kwoniella heveanensis CBS 569]|nr:hypothetical protein I317_00342 [Kwoniella heveanensis CBS 569]
MDIDSPPSPEYPTGTDASPHKHIHLPGFSSSFPLPFRVLFLIGLAQLLWAVNLHVLHLLGLDTSWILDLREEPDLVDPDSPTITSLAEEGDIELSHQPVSASSNPSSASHQHSHSHSAARFRPGEISLDDEHDDQPDTPIRPRTRHSPNANGYLPSSSASSSALPSGRILRPPSSKLHRGVYQLFLLYTAWCGGGWILFRWLSGGVAEEMEKWRIIPGLLAIGVAVGVAVPWKGVGERERAGLRKAMHRILFPPLNSPIFFSDVILADILTSFAKVLGDMWISTVQIWVGDISKGRVGVGGFGRYITLAMVSFPYMLRFRQCLLEYYQSSWTSRRPLANALKYFSAFPVIFLSAAQKTVLSEIALQKGITVEELRQTHDRWFGEHRLFRLWLLAVCVNSMFSFYWDVEMDWGLALCEVDTWLGPKGGRAEKMAGLLNSPVLGHFRRTSSSSLSTRRGLTGLGLGGGNSNSDIGFFERIKRLFTRPHIINHQRSPCPTPGPTFSNILNSKGLSGSSSSSAGHHSPESSTRASSSTPSPIGLGLRVDTGSTSSSGSASSLGLSTRQKSIFTFGLRQTLLLPDPLVYHLFTAIDLILRFTWSLKLSSHLHTISEIESGVFMMEALELLRRWMWVFIRVEWEAVKMGEIARFGGSAAGGVGGGGGGLGVGLGAGGGAGASSTTLWEEKPEDR